jgi:hypothetical protein
MLNFLKKAVAGPPAKQKVENYKPLQWEKNNVLQPYWEEPLQRNAMQDDEYPQPRVADDEYLARDGVVWDTCNIYKEDQWEKKYGGCVEAGGVIGGGGVNYVELSVAHDQNKDFKHMNEVPFFTGDPYYVVERPIDDGIDHYKRNDIKQRRSMKTGDFAIVGHNRETNLNRRAENQRADFESTIMPSRYKHDVSSIMPWDQLRDHSHNGKLYLPGDEPTAENPLGVEYRPEEKTYEELFNKTRVEAPGRVNVPLMGEKLFYHKQIHHLKRKDVDELAQWDHSGFMTGDYQKQSTDGLATLKSEQKTLPDYEYYGVATGTKATADRVEGFTEARATNRGHGKDTEGTLLGALGAIKDTVIGALSMTKNRGDGTVGGNDEGMNRIGNKTEHFNYTTWEPLEGREEKLFAVWNSRIEGYAGTMANRGGRIGIDKATLQRTRRENYESAVRPEGNMQNGTNNGSMIAGATESNKRGDNINRATFGDVTLDQGMTQIANTGHTVRDDINVAQGLKLKLSSLYSTAASALGIVNNEIKAGKISGNVTKNRGRKENFEENLYLNAPVARLAGDGYLITEHEPRETLRTKIVNNYVGNGYKDFGIVSHEGANAIQWHKDRMRKENVAETGSRANGPGKQDLGLGADQIDVDLWSKAKREIKNQVINPGARSAHAMRYGGEGLVNRSGTSSQKRVERSVNDGVVREFDFLKPRITKSGRDTMRDNNRAARRASRAAAKISPA